MAGQWRNRGKSQEQRHRRLRWAYRVGGAEMHGHAPFGGGRTETPPSFRFPASAGGGGASGGLSQGGGSARGQLSHPHSNAKNNKDTLSEEEAEPENRDRIGERSLSCLRAKVSPSMAVVKATEERNNQGTSHTGPAGCPLSSGHGLPHLPPCADGRAQRDTGVSLLSTHGPPRRPVENLELSRGLSSSATFKKSCDF